MIGKLKQFIHEYYKPQPCPCCHYEIPFKQKRKIPISRFSSFGYPQCKKVLYLKGSWQLWLLTVIWFITALCFHAFVLRTALTNSIFTIVSLFLFGECVRWIFVPKLPIHEL